MSDIKLRSLQRQADSGDPLARAALLTERVRSGTLTREMVELAAYAGDVAARAALPPFADDPTTASGKATACDPCINADGRNYTFDTPGGWHCLRHATEHPDLALWVRGLSRWGPEALVRAAVAAARQALPIWASGECADAHSSHPDWQAPLRHLRLVCGNAARARSAIEAAEAWLACPCDAHIREWYEARDVAGPGVWLPYPNASRQQVGDRISALSADARIKEAAKIAGEPRVRDAVRSSLVAWALA